MNFQLVIKARRLLVQLRLTFLYSLQASNGPLIKHQPAHFTSSLTFRHPWSAANLRLSEACSITCMKMIGHGLGEVLDVGYRHSASYARSHLFLRVNDVSFCKNTTSGVYNQIVKIKLFMCQDLITAMHLSYAALVVPATSH